MAATDKNEAKTERRTPLYQTVDGVRLPGFFSAEALRSALAYKPCPGDLFIATYPKCGTTWVGNIVSCIFKNGKPFESAIEFFSQSPFLELTGAEVAKTMERPAAFKIHQPYHLAPMSPEAKYIFIARNPKDCCVSFYHHTENIPGYHFAGGSFDDYFELFVKGEVDWGDYFDIVLSWYEHRNDPNVLFMSYEELKNDTAASVLKIAEFMGADYKEALMKDDGKILQDVLKHSDFSFMKKRLSLFISEMQSLPKELIRNNPDIPAGVRAVFGKEGDSIQKDPDNNSFVRKGIVGDWKNYFSPEQSARLEKKFREKMGDTELAELWKDVM